MLWLKQDKGIVVINWDTSAFKFAIFISWKNEMVEIEHGPEFMYSWQEASLGSLLP